MKKARHIAQQGRSMSTTLGGLQQPNHHLGAMFLSSKSRDLLFVVFLVLACSHGLRKMSRMLAFSSLKHVISMSGEDHTEEMEKAVKETKEDRIERKALKLLNEFLYKSLSIPEELHGKVISKPRIVYKFQQTFRS